jgi:hypothetical protein
MEILLIAISAGSPFARRVIDEPLQIRCKSVRLISHTFAAAPRLGGVSRAVLKLCLQSIDRRDDSLVGALISGTRSRDGASRALLPANPSIGRTQ